MTSYRPPLQLLAALLAALAGFVDATGFIATGGYFVSFMSGNSTRLGIGLAGLNDSATAAGGLIGAFLLGVMCGALVGHRARAARAAVVLWLVAGLLMLAAILGMRGNVLSAVGFLAFSMGAINNVFVKSGEVSVGVTYMTGSLVKLGQRIAAALVGYDRWGWVSYLAFWLSFVSGVVIGAYTYPLVGFAGVFGAAALAAVLASASVAVPIDYNPHRAAAEQI